MSADIRPIITHPRLSSTPELVPGRLSRSRAPRLARWQTDCSMESRWRAQARDERAIRQMGDLLPCYRALLVAPTVTSSPPRSIKYGPSRLGCSRALRSVAASASVSHRIHPRQPDRAAPTPRIGHKSSVGKRSWKLSSHGQDRTKLRRALIRPLSIDRDSPAYFLASDYF